MDAAPHGSSQGDLSSPLPASPEVVGRRYQVLEVVGRGGMGTVYLARDRLAGVVALKRLHRSVDELAEDATRSFGSNTAPPQIALGLADEFKVLTSLHHPHVISVLDYGFDDQARPYYTMDLLKGALTITEAGKNQPHEERVRLLAIEVKVEKGVLTGRARRVRKTPGGRKLRQGSPDNICKTLWLGRPLRHSIATPRRNQGKPPSA
jgi:hypothetical protein